MKRVCLAFTVTLAISTLAACNSSKASDRPTAPSLPALPGVTVSTLVVTNQPPSGNTIQLVATARMSDGSSQTVTNGVMWESSNPAIATISSSGLLTVLANGQVDATLTRNLKFHRSASFATVHGVVAFTSFNSYNYWARASSRM